MTAASKPSKPSREPRISQAMSVGRASLLVSGLILLSRIAGFLRWMVTSHLYGASPQTDAYGAAFNIPDTLVTLIAGGALATGFVPVFTELLSRGETEAAKRTFRAMLTLLFLVLGVFTLALLALTFTDWGRHLALATGQTKPETLELYLRMLRILLLAQFVLVLGGIFSGTLNALRQFVYPALLPIALSGGVIVGGLCDALSGKRLGIEAQAWGALFGALCGALLLQLPAALRNGLSPKPLWSPRDPGVQRVLSSMGPIVFGLASGQIIGLNLPQFFAGTLPAGELSALRYANVVMQTPLAFLASGTAIALFPTLSLLAAQGDHGGLLVQLSDALRRVLVLIFAAGALMMALSYAIVQLLFEHGSFGREDTMLTAQVLWCYGLCLPGLAAQQLLARGFYAIGDTRPPVRLGLAAMLAFMLYGIAGTRWHLFGAFGAPHLALGAAACATFLGVGMWLALRARLGGWDAGKTTRALLRGAVAACLASMVAFWVWKFASQLRFEESAWKYVARTAVLGTSALCGGAAWLLVARLLKLKVGRR